MWRRRLGFGRRPVPCSSWSDVTVRPDSRAAPIARAAAEAPVIVVMHGMPVSIAARRISHRRRVRRARPGC